MLQQQPQAKAAGGLSSEVLAQDYTTQHPGTKLRRG